MSRRFRLRCLLFGHDPEGPDMLGEYHCRRCHWLLRWKARGGFEKCEDPYGEREVCQLCGRGYAIWSAPSDLWNLTVRGGDRAAAEDFSFLCPRCFMLLCEGRVPQAGKLWIVRPECESDFEDFKPSGRFAPGGMEGGA